MFLSHCLALSLFAECDRMFISTPEGARNGTFSAPHMDIISSGPTIPTSTNGTLYC